MVWHHHDDDVPGPDAAVDLRLAGLPSGVSRAALAHYRVDQTHSNAYGAWQRMGSPIAPDEAQYAELQSASELATPAGSPDTVPVETGAARVSFRLPRQGVSLLVVRW